MRTAGRCRARGGRRGGAAGFTLTELTVAMLLLTVGILALAGVMVTVSVRQSRATVLTEMTTLAESKLEELRAYSMLRSADTSQVALGGLLTESVVNHADEVPGPTGRSYLRRWLVEAGPAGTRTLTLRVESSTQIREQVGAKDFMTRLMVVR